MRVFDWQALLREQNIPHIERGPNVKRGELNVKCPWCGAADPSYHLGLNLATGFYACWRNKAGHSGKSPLRLIMKLLNVDYQRARAIAGLGDDYVDPEGFDALVARLMGRNHDPVKPLAKATYLEFDKYFLDISQKPRTARWWNYLYGRRFEADDIEDLCKRYELKAARGGNWDWRLILPYFLDGKLVSWTGRAIADSKIRYKDLSNEGSIVPPKETLFNHDCVFSNGRRTLLVIQEGPMDALKLDYYGQRWGVRSVALSTNSMTEHQVYMLQAAADRFERVGICMDNKNGLGVVDSMRRKQELAFISKLEALTVPAGRGDFGECYHDEVHSFCQAHT